MTSQKTQRHTRSRKREWHMARRMTGPRKNTNRSRRRDLAQLVSVIYRKPARLLTHQWTAVSGFFALTLLFGGPGQIAASQDERQIATAKVDWGVFLPVGEGKAEVSLACSSCHDLRQVITQKKSCQLERHGQEDDLSVSGSRGQGRL